MRESASNKRSRGLAPPKRPSIAGRIFAGGLTVLIIFGLFTMLLPQHTQDRIWSTLGNLWGILVAGGIVVLVLVVLLYGFLALLIK